MTDNPNLTPAPDPNFPANPDGVFQSHADAVDTEPPLADQQVALGGDYERSRASDYTGAYDGDSEDYQPVQSDGDLLNAIHLALRSFSTDYDYDFEIEVKSGEVYLQGDVASEADRDEITQVIQSVDGVNDVHGSLTIVG